jgi:hypothetical protein
LDLIWLTRNQAMWPVNAYHLAGRIKKVNLEQVNAWKNLHPSTRESWISPPRHTLKINFDVAIRDNSLYLLLFAVILRVALSMLGLRFAPLVTPALERLFQVLRLFNHLSRLGWLISFWKVILSLQSLCSKIANSQRIGESLPSLRTPLSCFLLCPSGW